MLVNVNFNLNGNLEFLLFWLQVCDLFLFSVVCFSPLWLYYNVMAYDV